MKRFFTIVDSHTIKFCKDENFSKPPNWCHSTNKTDVYHIDDIWSLDHLDSKDWSPENFKGYRYILVEIDIFSIFGLTFALKNKIDQTVTDTFEKIFINSKRKQNLIQTDRGKDFNSNLFKNFLINNSIEHYSRNTSLGAVFSERFKKI